MTMTVVYEDDCEGVHDNIEYTVAKETGLVRTGNDQKDFIVISYFMNMTINDCFHNWFQYIINSSS